jgi:drug/metabolite transporter (DMT)-like permease
MCGTLMSFLTMAIAARELSDTLNPFQIVFMRTSVALVIVLAMVAHQGKAAIYTQRLPLHFFRNIIHYGANLFWIVGVGLIPLAQVFALEFSIPIWVALLAVVFLKEKMTIGKIVAIVLGFAGVLIILRPGLVSTDFGSLAVLAASLGFAISNVATKSLARQDSALTIIFLMFLMQWPIGAIGASIVWITPEWADVPWIALIGVTALTAHYTMTRALMLADATVVIPIDFIRMPMIAVIGFFFYAEPFSAWIFLGAGLIFAGNYYSIYRERRRG